jgi:hypothetical protein
MKLKLFPLLLQLIESCALGLAIIDNFVLYLSLAFITGSRALALNPCFI